MAFYDNLIVKDTLEAYVIDDTNSATYFFGATEESNIKQTIDQQKLTAGIGNKVKALLQSSKQVEFSIKNLFHSDSFLAIQTGSTFTTASKDLMKKEVKTAVDNLGSIEVIITGTPKDDEVTVLDKYNTSYTASYAAGTVTITGGVEGTSYTVVYLETTADVNVLDLNAEKYPTTKHVQLHGIAYDPDTNAILADIYYDFNEAVPDGNVDRNYAKGSNISDVINFSTQEDDNGNYGEYYIVPRS